MTGFQDVRDGIARVIGGTAPDPINRPRWFSGADTGDSSGVAGILGCYSTAQANITTAGGGAVGSAVGMVLLGAGNVDFPASRDSLVPSQEYTWDNPRLLIMVPRQDPETEEALLAPFQDSVRTAFRAHMTLFSNVDQAWANTWHLVAYKVGGSEFLAWEFTIRVMRVKNVSYVP